MESYCGSSKDIMKKMVSRRTLVFVTPQSRAFTANTGEASNVFRTGLTTDLQAGFWVIVWLARCNVTPTTSRLMREECRQ